VRDLNGKRLCPGDLVAHLGSSGDVRTGIVKAVFDNRIRVYWAEYHDGRGSGSLGFTSSVSSKHRIVRIKAAE
jgi:hypothetical protein